MEDLQAPSGQHQGVRVAFTEEEGGLKNSGDRVRDKAEGGTKNEMRRRRGHKAGDTLNREVAVCAI